MKEPLPHENLIASGSESPRDGQEKLGKKERLKKEISPKISWGTVWIQLGYIGFTKSVSSKYGPPDDDKFVKGLHHLETLTGFKVTTYIVVRSLVYKTIIL